MVLDTHTDAVQPLRDVLAVASIPVHHTANLPVTLNHASQDMTRSRQALEADVATKTTEVLTLRREIQVLQAQLRQARQVGTLLGSANVPQSAIIVGEIVGVDPDPFRHEVIINKGSEDGVVAGQAMLDGDGLMGQVTRVEPFSARVLLISDVSHGVPVHLIRNGVRAIAVGSGQLEHLQLLHVPDTADIKVGDQLVTSGLGGRFTKGVPVGQVTQVKHDPGKPFATVRAQPKAHLDRSRYVMLVALP